MNLAIKIIHTKHKAKIFSFFINNDQITQRNDFKVLE